MRMEPERTNVTIAVAGATLIGELAVPDGARCVVLFAHGSGSSRLSPRNTRVAAQLRAQGLGTLLFDLLTAEEERDDAHTGRYRFDIALLAARLVGATEWLARQFAPPAMAYFGASTGAAAALIAAAELPAAISAAVSRGGRPDLAHEALGRVRAPTLLVVGGRDPVVLELNERAFAQLRCVKELVVVPGATHLFEEPGTLDEVADHAARWFLRHCTAATTGTVTPE